MNYIECINVDYKSTRKESFYDLQLDVKGCKDVYASFDKYVEVERLEGDNKYHAEQHGLQINDRYEFPLELDLDRENGKYLSPEADRRVSQPLHAPQCFGSQWWGAWWTLLCFYQAHSL
uniref:Uncharacterized protein n=1 Tax=Nelumbo nucifera TaxID=4432 RepID=A0A822XW96_NELNU|nr:TPA_asm: hypothetical protein HUJ06_025476 [Nelumbo nucifera]